MNIPGRPTSYKGAFNTLAKNDCRLDATDEKIARFFEVSPRTIDNWIIAHPGFAAAARDAPVHADAEVASRVHERSLGEVQRIEGSLFAGPRRLHFLAMQPGPRDLAVPARRLAGGYRRVDGHVGSGRQRDAPDRQRPRSSARLKPVPPYASHACRRSPRLRIAALDSLAQSCGLSLPSPNGIPGWR